MVKGKFRSYLLACCKNFLANVYSWENATKWGGGTFSIAVDALEAEDQFHAEIANFSTPEKAFDKSWALAVIGRVIKDMEKEHQKTGKESHFVLLRPLMTMESQEQGYSQIARDLETTESNIQIMVFRLRRKFAKKLREELRSTVEDPSEVEMNFAI